MTNEKLNTIQAERVIIRDTFEDDRPAGQVAGTYSTSGVLRQGSDVEGVLSIDNGALRIGYLRKLGWGRHGIAYGPYKRRPGLAFSVLFLNGHNNSQTETTPAQSMKNWVRKTIKKYCIRSVYIMSRPIPGLYYTRQRSKQTWPSVGIQHQDWSIRLRKVIPSSCKLPIPLTASYTL